jgi:hypothetical protein
MYSISTIFRSYFGGGLVFYRHSIYKNYNIFLEKCRKKALMTDNNISRARLSEGETIVL